MPVTRALRAAMIEASEYLNCALYLKDECMDVYDAKDEKRKSETSDALDF